LSFSLFWNQIHLRQGYDGQKCLKKHSLFFETSRTKLAFSINQLTMAMRLLSLLLSMTSITFQGIVISRTIRVLRRWSKLSLLDQASKLRNEAELRATQTKEQQVSEKRTRSIVSAQGICSRYLMLKASEDCKPMRSFRWRAERRLLLRGTFESICYDGISLLDRHHHILFVHDSWCWICHTLIVRWRVAGSLSIDTTNTCWNCSTNSHWYRIAPFGSIVEFERSRVDQTRGSWALVQ
jgi:hypothetical protein